MTAAHDLAAAWEAASSGRELDLDTFLSRTITLVADGFVVRVEHRGGDQISIRVDDEAVECSTASARGKLRILCARLASLFATTSPAPFYGGEIENTVSFGPNVVRARLVFQNNNAGSVFFVLSRRT